MTNSLSLENPFYLQIQEIILQCVLLKVKKEVITKFSWLAKKLLRQQIRENSKDL